MDRLEYVTNKSFIHGQGVGLGVYLGAALQENEPEAILETLHGQALTYGLRRWVYDAANALRRLGWYVGASPTRSRMHGR